MTIDLQASPLATLKELGIINANHYRRALAHPQLAELDGSPDMPDHLVWLVCRDIMTEEDVQQACVDAAARFSGDELQRRDDVLGVALIMLERLRDSFNKDFFNTLVTEALITADERDAALENMSPDNVLASPAAALAWMVLVGVTDRDVFQDAAAATGSPERAAIAAEAKDIVKKTRAATRSAVLGAILPGPGWMWIAALVLFVGYLGWTIFKPDLPPACTDSDIARTVDAMMFKVGVDARLNDMSRGLGKTTPTPRVHGIKEVGYATEIRVRGCIGKLTMGKTEVPYAFTIAPSGAEKGEYAVIGAEPAIVQARFGHLDAKGKFLNQAQPLGRAEVERAFRAGVESTGQSPHALVKIPERGGGLSTMAPERTREIAEIEPMAPCREIKPGTVYSCRLLIERNDALMAAFTGSSGTLIDSAFTFERDSATGPWRVSDTFADEYMKAMVAGRVKAITE
jgi:hypothetical protein